jgi:hypothetical protein
MAGITPPAWARTRAGNRKLTRLGYRVLRLDAELVRRDVHAAVEQVRSALMPPPQRPLSGLAGK